MALTARIRGGKPAVTKPRTLRRQRERTDTPLRSDEALTAALRYDNDLHSKPLYVDTLQASALSATKRNAQDIRRLIQPWQAQSQSYCDLVPEVKFATRFMGNLLRRVRLYPAMIDPKTHEPEEVDSGPLFDLFNVIVDPSGGRESLQEQYAMLRFLIGESYLTVSPSEEFGQVWECLSPNELRVQPGGIASRFRAPMLSADQYNIGVSEYIVANDPANIAEYGQIGPAFSEEGPDVIVVYRLWRPSVPYTWLADCNMKAAVESGILEELVLSTYSVRAQLKSRMNQNGVWFVPDEISFASLGNDPEEDPGSDIFQQRLTEVMMASLRDPGSAEAMLPIIARVAAEYCDKAKLQKFNDTQGELAEINQRSEMVERFAVGCELPPELFKSQADMNHWCVDEETEILTRDKGWVTQNDLHAGDVVRTLNHETGLAEWQAIESVYRAEVEDEPMRFLESKTHSSITTLNHRWPVLRTRWEDGVGVTAREWTTSAELTVPHSIITGAFAGDEPEQVHADAFVELLAWFWTEGHIGASDGVSIAQSHTVNPDRVDRIRGCLTRLFGPSVDTLRASKQAAWREKIQQNKTSFGGPITVFYLNQIAASELLLTAPGKIVSGDFICELTSAQLELFIDVSCQGDGHHYRKGELDLWQRDSAAVEAFALAVILSGRGCSTLPSHDDGTTVRALRSNTVRPVKAAYESDRIGSDGATDAIVPYTGVIWCPTTPNHTWLARRKGRTFYTGNTGWLIDEQTWKGYGHPAALEMASDFNAAYLQPAAREQGIKDWQNVCIGIDPSAVINHPDRAKDADALYNGRAISKKVWRESKGYNDNDAMPDDELNEMLGVQIRDGSLAVYGIPSVRANIEPTEGDIESATGEVTSTTTPEGAGADVERGAPQTGPNATAEQNATPALQASAMMQLEQRILGAADLTIQRGRELAGARLRARLTPNRGRGAEARCEECLSAISERPNWDVAWSLGSEQVRFLKIDAGLVDGTAELFATTVERMGVPRTWATQLGEFVEQHAARTVFDENPAPMPPAFVKLLGRINVPIES